MHFSLFPCTFMKAVILSNAIPFKNFCNFIRRAFMQETCYFKNSRREGKFAGGKKEVLQLDLQALSKLCISATIIILTSRLEFAALQGKIRKREQFVIMIIFIRSEIKKKKMKEEKKSKNFPPCSSKVIGYFWDFEALMWNEKERNKMYKKENYFWEKFCFVL